MYQYHLVSTKRQRLLRVESCLRFDIWKYVSQEIFRKPSRLFVRLFEPLPSAIVWVADDLCPTRPRVFPKQHDLGLAVRFTLFHSFELGEVRSVHGENIVEFIEVARIHLMRPQLGAHNIESSETFRRTLRAACT